MGLLHHLGLDLDALDKYGQSPLHLASLRGNHDVVEVRPRAGIISALY